MRAELIDYFQSLDLPGFGVSKELPFTNNATVLYIKNPKKIYADIPQLTDDLTIPLLASNGISQEVHSVSVFFSTDAKTLPANYESIVSKIKQGKNIKTDINYFKREVDITTSFEGDLLITEIAFRFTKLN